MNVRSFFLCLCTSFVFIGAAGAQASGPVLATPLPPAPPKLPMLTPGAGVVPPPSANEMRAMDAINKDTQIASRVDVSFSGAQQERFVFEESGGAIVEEGGVALRLVGSGAMEMGARKTSVSIYREDLNPEVF